MRNYTDRLIWQVAEKVKEVLITIRDIEGRLASLEQRMKVVEDELDEAELK